MYAKFILTLHVILDDKVSKIKVAPDLFLIVQGNCLIPTFLVFEIFSFDRQKIGIEISRLQHISTSF